MQVCNVTHSPKKQKRVTLGPNLGHMMIDLDSIPLTYHTFGNFRHFGREKDGKEK